MIANRTTLAQLGRGGKAKAKKPRGVWPKPERGQLLQRWSVWPVYEAAGISTVGRLHIVRFVLRLHECEPQDRRRKIRAWVAAKKRKDILDIYRFQWREQNGKRAPVELPPGALVVGIRFSSKQPDERADWMKTPQDCLTRGRKYAGKWRAGLGLLHDDSHEWIESHELWAQENHPTKREPWDWQGCLIDVWGPRT